MRPSKVQIQSFPPWIWNSLLLLSLAVLLAPGTAQASTAAGTVLTNSVTVNYDDQGGAAQTPVNASVNVTISLVGSVAWGSAPAGQNAGSGGALPGAYSLTLRNTGNGSDTFTITDGTTQSSVNLTAGTIAVTAPADEDAAAGYQLKLFGTISSGAGVFGGVTTAIPVGNLTVADLTAGVTTVRIGAGTYTVAAGSTATSLVVTGDASANVAAAGVQIGEIVTVSYNGSAGTLSGGTTSATHNHSLTSTGLSQNGNPAATATVNGWATTVQGATLTVNKYVRNLLNANGNTGGAGATAINGGATYYTGGVTGNPGDTLEYAIVIANSGGGNATDVVMEDTLPPYTNYVASSIQVDTNGDTTYDVTLPGSDTEAHDQVGGIVETNTGVAATTAKIKVYAGTGGSETAVGGYGGTGGTVAGGGSTVVLYRITID